VAAPVLAVTGEGYHAAAKPLAPQPEENSAS